MTEIALPAFPAGHQLLDAPECRDSQSRALGGRRLVSVRPLVVIVCQLLSFVRSGNNSPSSSCLQTKTPAATFRFQTCLCVFTHTSCLSGLLCGRGLLATRIACLQAFIACLYNCLTYTLLHCHLHSLSPTLAPSLTLCTLPTLHLHSSLTWPHTSRVSSGAPTTYHTLTHSHLHLVFRSLPVNLVHLDHPLHTSHPPLFLPSPPPWPSCPALSCLYCTVLY